MSLLAPLLLPPLSLAVLALLAGLLAWRGYRPAGLVAALAGGGILLLATPLVAGWLVRSLDPGAAQGGEPPAAIIILGGDVARGGTGADIGMLTLERLRAGAALHRRSGLPILVTGGVLAEGQPPLARLMARSLAEDFGVTARWVEPRAADTRENAAFATEMLRAEGISAAWLVTQSWHMPRAREAFARQGFATRPASVRPVTISVLELSALRPRSDHLMESWFALHEWAGRAFYALRDGRTP